LFSVATALSHSYDILLLARLATGLGFGGAMPNLIAVATEISAPGKRAGTVTTMFCGMPAGGATVALLAKFAGPSLPWRDLFMIGGALPLLLTPVVLFLLPETRPEPVQGSDRSLPRALFGNGRAPGTLLLWAAFFLTLVILYLMLNWLPTLVIAKGLTAADGSTASMWFNLVGIAGALSLGFVVDRAGFRWPLIAVYVALAATMFALASATALNPVLILSGVAGFMVLAAQYSLYAVAPSLYPPQVRAAGAGAAVGVGRLGSVAGPILAGQLREAGYGAGQVFGFMTPVVLAAGVAVLALSFFSRTHDG
jgi:AAHS family 3-hydroxyphenylpropionic acid transporter